MPDTWNHPRLGTLQNNDLFWEGKIIFPSLDSFTYIDAVVRKYQSTHNPFELAFFCDSEDEHPTEEMASLAITTIDNQPQLMPKVLDAIWSDLIGRGPDSGMWWHGDLPNSSSWTSAVHEILTKLELPVPACADDLKKVLEPKSLTIRRDDRTLRRGRAPSKQWIAELNFHAGFDIDHGVGVMTDGIQVLGMGYDSDATPFDR